jgi:hypothetical protein
MAFIYRYDRHNTLFERTHDTLIDALAEKP